MGYSQNDPAWSGITLGGGPDTIGRDGCYLTSFSMEATFMGQTINPAQLNAKMKSMGIFGAGCAECLPDDALQRAFPSVARLANVWNYYTSPADLGKLSNASPTVFKCVEMEIGRDAAGNPSYHFAPVVDGSKGAGSTILDPWPNPARVRPISDYCWANAPTVQALVVKITENDWLTPAPQPPMPAPPPDPTGYWPGWDIARGLVMLNPTDGIKLDGWGGLHPIGNVPQPFVGGASWPGWDIARDIAMNPDGVTGYVLDGWGGLHPFALGSATVPPVPPGGAYWAGWDIAKRLVVTGQGSGFIMDGWGGRHPFG